MPSTIVQPELQLRTLRLYGELLSRKSDWRGQLVLSAFPGAASCGFAAAASLAGAASLIVDHDSQAVKAHFRDGAFDFVVNKLDEALRALKNELRQRRPIAIGLIGEPTLVCAEAVERGLAATAILVEADDPRDLESSLLAKDGLTLSHAYKPIPSPELNHWLGERNWVPELSNTRLQHDDTIRQRWQRDLPTHQRSAGKGMRWEWLSSLG